MCGRVALGVTAGRRVERVSKIRSMETVWALETLRVAALLLPNGFARMTGRAFGAGCEVESPSMAKFSV